MGSLAQLRLPTAEIKVPGVEGQTFHVRGLAVADLSDLLRVHGEEIQKVYSQTVLETDSGFEPTEIAKALMKSCPLAVAQIIALAADEPDLVDVVRRLPFTVQINALAEIGVLTFHSEAALGEFLETVILGSKVMTRTIQRMTGSLVILQDGSGSDAAT